MKLILCISFLFLLSCNVEEIEPQLVEEYFFGAQTAQPTTLPTTKELSGIYFITRTGVDFYSNFDIKQNLVVKEISVKAIDTKKMYLEMPSNCVVPCTNINNIGIDYSNISFELSGFNINIHDQIFKDGLGQSNIYLTSGKGKINISKNQITLSHTLEYGGTLKAKFNYTLTKKL